MGLHQAEGRVVADRADVAEMIGKPLEFRKQRPQPDRAVRHRKLQRRFGGLRKRIGIGDGAVARYASGELSAALDAGAAHQPLDALVGISQPLFQPDHGLPAGGKAEMSGLDDARMHGTDRNLMQAIAFRRQEAVGRRRRQRVDAISQAESVRPNGCDRARGGCPASLPPTNPNRSLTVRSNRSAGGWCWPTEG